MSKCSVFIKFFDELVEKTNSVLPEDVQEFYDTLVSSQNLNSNKPEFTETGLIILEYLQNIEGKNLKAKDIADGIMLPSRKISGAMRKLVGDGYVEKFGANPVIYSITDQGKQINISNYKETKTL